MKLINLEKLRNGKLLDKPYRSAFIHNFIDYESMCKLHGNFPKDGFRYFTREKYVDNYYISRNFEEKHYKMCGRSLVIAGEKEINGREGLDNIWQELCDDLLSNEYKEAMSELVQIDLTKCHIQVDLWRYHPGCYTAPHTDDPWKSASQILYLVKEQWNPEWGGIGRMHNFDKDDHIAVETLPSMDISPVFIRSDKSYHSISEVNKKAPEARKVIDIVFYNTLPLPQRPGMKVGNVLSPNDFIF